MWSRSAPVRGSTILCTIELNCLPRRVARMKRRVAPVAMAGAVTRESAAIDGGRTGWKWALPSGVGKLRSRQSIGPPTWN